jgi:hypothetical protein
VADRLTTPIVFFYWVFNAQIVNLYNDGVPERAFVGQVERVLGWGYSEATSTSVTVTVVSTERKLVDRGRESGSEIYAACCRKIIISRSACGDGSVEVPRNTHEKKNPRLLTGKCTVMSRCEGRTAARVLHPAIGITT